MVGPTVALQHSSLILDRMLPFNNFQTGFHPVGAILKPKLKVLNWSSVTSINKTAISLRNTIRKSHKLTFYPRALRAMLIARNKIKSMKRAKGDRRLRQINMEIQRTKRTFLDRYLKLRPQVAMAFMPIR